MKIKPINSFNQSTIKDIRYNENTTGICVTIKSGILNSEKRDYSALSLMSCMYEKKYLKHELIKESFEEAKEKVIIYEGNRL